MQFYNTQAGRINILKGEILAHAIPVEVLGITGSQKPHPKNVGDTQIFRRWVPFGAAANANRPIAVAQTHILSEGATPDADTLTPQDVSVTLQQYGALYAVTDRAADLYEDNIPDAMKEQTGERMGLVREMIRYGALKAGTNATYAGGTSRATVASKVTLASLRKVTRTLRANHSMQITSILAASPNFATTPVEAAWLVFCHSDFEQDIRDLPGYKHPAEYGTRKPVHDMEIGSCEAFRFIISPELNSYQNAGVAVGATGLFATSTNVDVYPMLIVGKDAWGQVALRGVDSIDPTWIPPGTKSGADPLGQRGYIGAKFYAASVILNQGWMAVLEAGVTNLP